MKGKLPRILLAAVLCAAACVSAVITASAESKTYTVSEIDSMSIALPDGMSAVTRSSKSTDKYFALFGLNYNTTMSNFEKGGIYLQGMDNLSKTTLTVTMTRTDESEAIGNYNQLQSDRLSEIQSNFLGTGGYVSCTPDTAGKVTWLRFNVNFTESGRTIRGYQANTVYDGMNVNIVLQRNNGSVTAEDYAVFGSIVDSVDFAQTSAAYNLFPYYIIGGAAIAVILLIVIILIVRSAKRRRKSRRNNQILLELAGQYSGSKKDGGSAEEKRRGEEKRNREPVLEEVYYDRRAREKKNYEGSFEDVSSSSPAEKAQPAEKLSESEAPTKIEIEDDDDFFNNYTPVSARRKPARDYSDDDINALLAYDPDKGSFEEQAFAEVIPAEEAESVPAEAEDLEAEAAPEAPKSEEINISESVKADEEAVSEPVETEEESESEAVKATEAEDESENGETAEASDEPVQQKDSSDDKSGSDSLEEVRTEEADNSENVKNEKQTTRKFTLGRDKISSGADADIDSTMRYSLKNFDESRSVTHDAVNPTVFGGSDDFFDEAPDRITGIISGADLIGAEDYDVIGEEERRARKIADDGNEENTVLHALKSAGSGVKSFFVHCGYFFTNLTRSAKRRRNAKARAQARRAQPARRPDNAAHSGQREVRRSSDGELVQVHRRYDSRRSYDDN